MKVFISYDTRDIEWANFLRTAIETRLNSGDTVFVAKTDIKPGESPLTRMLDEELKQAKAVVAICSPRSKTSPWLWWESSSAWAREEKVFPLFLELAASEFGSPLSLISQGRTFDADGVEDVCSQLLIHLYGAGSASLDPDERNILASLAAQANASPFELDCDGPGCIYEETGLSLRRVRLTNRGPRSISGVEVKMSSFTPQGAPGLLPVRIRRTHNEPHPFEIARGADSYFDVVAWWQGSPQYFVLQYDVPLPNMIAVGRYEISLTVTGNGDAPPLTRTFVVDFGHGNIPTWGLIR